MKARACITNPNWGDLQGATAGLGGQIMGKLKVGSDLRLRDIRGHGFRNLVRGRFSTDYPRRPLADFIMEHAPRPVDVVDPTLLIRINRQFRYGMSAEALYESTRGIWVVGERRNRAKFAMAVYAGIVREVYEIVSWHHAGTTTYSTRSQAELAKQKSKRWEFIGNVASEPERSRYIGRSVAHLFRAGQQSPVVGIGLDG